MLQNRGRFAATGAFLGVATLLLSACGDNEGGDSQGADGAEDTGDQDTEFLTLATGGSSGVYYQIGATMAEVLADELGSDTSVQATGAAVENINLITDGNAELAMTMADANTQALEGIGPFDGEPRDGLMAITTMYPNVVQLIARADAGIESVEDLEDTNVAVGDIGSGAELNAQTILSAYDLTYDDLNEDYLSFAEATDQMANGHIDAVFATSGVPNPAVTELATNNELVVVPIEGEARETLLSENDFFSEAVVPAGTYDNGEDVETLGVMTHLLASSELSESAVYDITSVLFDNLERIHNSHAEAQNITAETATEGLSVPLHPGAERYYEESGIETDRGNDETGEDD